MSKKQPERPEISGPLAYTGTAFLNGIPARDLSAADLAALAQRDRVTTDGLRERLLASGLYQSPPAEPAAVAEVSTDE